MWLVNHEMADVPGKEHENTSAEWGPRGGTVQIDVSWGRTWEGHHRLCMCWGSLGEDCCSMCSRRLELDGTWRTYAGKSEIESHGRIFMQKDQNLNRMTCNLP